ncbi:MAG: hypothetical protein JL50_17045 [Peptococcaceae bacterium BICA1-7]|nr:MAG: hypothetical protein JL50_17045 [Peptococcaceae bacterium BICA1-7]
MRELILSYVRNKHCTVVDRPDGSLLARASVEEKFFSARVEMVVAVPGLEISSAEAAIERCFAGRCRESADLALKVPGLRVGPGIIKLVNSLLGGPKGCPRLAELVLECCEQVILRFTVEPLRFILEKEEKDRIEAFKVFLRQNPRLVNSCIAFCDTSPLREGVDIEEF